jgi:hypothetical protein
VADRFHSVRNVSDALREVVDRQPWALPQPTVLPVSLIEETITNGPDRPTRASQKGEAAAERLRIRYEEVRRRFRNGESIRTISRATGLERKTVSKYVHAADAPKRAVRRPVPCALDSFVPRFASSYVLGVQRYIQRGERRAGRGYATAGKRFAGPSSALVSTCGRNRGSALQTCPPCTPRLPTHTASSSDSVTCCASTE